MIATAISPGNPSEKTALPRYIEVDGYKIREYEPPAVGDLKAHLALLRDFEGRFFHHIYRAQDIPDGRKNKRIKLRNPADPRPDILDNLDDPDNPDKLDAYIRARGTEYRRLKQEMQAAKEPDAKAGWEAGMMREESMLCGALLKRAYERMKRHIKSRMQSEKSGEIVAPEALNALKKNAGMDFLEASQLKLLRRQNLLDRDNVLEEMKGEPNNIFTGSISKTGGYTPVIRQFFQHRLETAPDVYSSRILEFFKNRYEKVAQAMHCIDRVTRTMSSLEKYRPYRELKMQGLLERFAEAAKERMQLVRSDPDFTEADRKLCAAHERIQSMVHPATISARPFAAPLKVIGQPLDPLAAMLITNANALIYDMAMTLAQQSRSASMLKESVDRFIALACRQQGPANHAR